MPATLLQKVDPSQKITFTGTFGPITLCSIEGILHVWVKDTRLILSPNERKIMVMLVQKPEIPIPHRAIEAALYPGLAPSVNSIKVFVWHIRKKMNAVEPGAGNHLRIEPRLGYFLSKTPAPQ